MKASRPGTSSAKVLAESGLVTAATGGGHLCGYLLFGGTTQSSVTFKAGGASGTTQWVHSIAAQTVAGDVCEGAIFPDPIVFGTNIYVVLAGTGAKVSVTYQGA